MIFESASFTRAPLFTYASRSAIRFSIAAGSGAAAAAAAGSSANAGAGARDNPKHVVINKSRANTSFFIAMFLQERGGVLRGFRTIGRARGGYVSARFRAPRLFPEQ